jgi:hypothetical protein
VPQIEKPNAPSAPTAAETTSPPCSKVITALFNWFSYRFPVLLPIDGTGPVPCHLPCVRTSEVFSVFLPGGLPFLFGVYCFSPGVNLLINLSSNINL